MVLSLIKLLLRIPLSDKDTLTIVNKVIHRDSLPFRSILSLDENRRVLVQGSPLTVEQSESVKEGAYALLKNPALKLIRDQIRFQAVDKGFFQTDEPKVQLFYKAALFYAQEELELTKVLAGEII